MFVYLEANMGLRQTPLNAAMRLAQRTHFDVGQVNYDDREGQYELRIGLGWHTEVTPEGQTITWHGGRTRGYAAYIGFDKESSTGVIVLSNYSGDYIVEMGEQIMEAIQRY
jgi:hypothetical protein